ncbi:hypothetical protein [Sulfurimonas paralvinellae]|uniref:Malate dehydrogenase n=1 Tax=Sulfurimonas paralvinellae TaxID=317658 RepID=A0A7M1B5E6_9BACT|nr:hypothetical protein [Sulfurimonas paralvinellae]QOP44949.1 hypothetical protein FM071_01000 [Sulfurimonas paralvinellae]
MAKKKKVIELTQKNLEFTENGITYKLIRFKPDTMTLDVIRYEDKNRLDEFSIPFAHLPKSLKKIVKPN